MEGLHLSAQLLYVILFSRSPFQFSLILFFKLCTKPVLGGKDCKCWLESTRGGGRILLGQGLTFSAFVFFTCTVSGVGRVALRSVPLALSLVKNQRLFLWVVDFTCKQSGKIRILGIQFQSLRKQTYVCAYIYTYLFIWNSTEKLCNF